MSDDLKQRLRKVEGGNHYGATVWYKNPDGPEAADRIEKLGELLHYVTGVADTNISGRLYAESRNEKLEAALQYVSDCLYIDDYGDYGLLSNFDAEKVNTALKGEKDD